MYKLFYGLREYPFNVNPDPRYLFLTSQTREALDEMTYGIQARKGLILLTGEVGTGKTTLINRLLDWLHQQQTPTAFIFNSHLEANHLLDFILADFRVPYDSRLDGNSLLRLNQWLIERYRAADTPVLIVDEAQGLPTHVLEEIRMLLNLETPHEKLIQIVLAGQPELEERLKRPELRQLRQRITLRCKTSALTLAETRDYIRARLHIAGANGHPIFAPDSVDAVHFFSGGIPRIVNLLCEHALINAYAEQARPVPLRVVADVAHEFQLDDILAFKDSVNASTASAIAIAETVIDGVDASATPVLEDEAVPPANRSTETSKEMHPSLNILAPALAAAWAAGAGPIERGQPSGASTFNSEAKMQAIAQSATEPGAPRAPVAFSSVINVVEAKRDLDFLPASGYCHVSAPEKPASPAAAAKTIHAIPSMPSTATQAPFHEPIQSGSRPMTPIASLVPGVHRFWRVMWNARWKRLLLSGKSSAWMQTTARMVGPLSRSLEPARTFWRRCLGWRDRCLAVARSEQWPRRKVSVLRWLAEPWTPGQQRSRAARHAEALRRVTEKKT